MGVPKAPKATGEVLASSARPAAYSGGKPMPINIAAEIATGVPKPAAPSRNVPKEKAIKRACTRRSGEMAATERFTTSNWPERSVRWNRNKAARTIQPMGSRPKHAPYPAAARAASAGMWKKNMEINRAVARPARAALGAEMPPASRPSKTRIGNPATPADSSHEPDGS